jgi:hypothetical protein
VFSSFAKLYIVCVTETFSTSIMVLTALLFQHNVKRSLTYLIYDMNVVTWLNYIYIFSQ